MQTEFSLKLAPAQALEIYPTAAPALKTIMEQSFPKGFFSTNILEKVNSIEDALLLKGKKMSDIILPGDTEDEIAYKVLKFGISVLNEGKKVLLDGNKYHYEPYFYNKPGFGLVYCNYFNYWPSDTLCRVRLSYHSLEVMHHGVKIFDKYYKMLLNHNENDN